jgi:hypothetical protein
VILIVQPDPDELNFDAESSASEGIAVSGPTGDAREQGKSRLEPIWTTAIFSATFRRDSWRAQFPTVPARIDTWIGLIADDVGQSVTKLLFGPEAASLPRARPV